MSKIGGQSGSFGIVAQNPWFIYADSKKIDPSQLEGTWNEGGQLHHTRSLGFNLKIAYFNIKITYT